MITTVIVLAVITVALGGFIALDILHDKRLVNRALAVAGPSQAHGPIEQAATKPAERVSQIAAANDGSTGEEKPNTNEGTEAPKKRGRKVYQDPVIIFVKPWLKPKIKEKKKRKGKAELESEPELQELETAAQAVAETPVEVAPPQAVTETPKSETVPESLADDMPNATEKLVAEEPATEEPVAEEPKAEEVDEVVEPEFDNDATENGGEADDDEVVDTENEEVDAEDEEVDAEDEEVDTEDEEVDAEDEAVDAEDEAVDAEDEAVDAEGEDVDAEDEQEETVVLKPATEGGRPEYIVIKYNRSFLAKLIQSDEWVKQCYSELKNKLLSYRKVKSRISWKCESFRFGRKTIAKLRLRGKTLSLCFVGNPDEYAGTKYAVESLAEVKSYAATPCLYRIRSNRRLLYAKQLIERVAEQEGLIERATEQTDYVAQYPYETTEALIERKLIKVLTDDDAQSGTAFKPSEVRAEVAATEVDKIMSDEVAASLIEKSEVKTDKTKQGIINIDTLSQCFVGGEVVTLAEIKKRVKGFNKKTTYVKVLARGTLDKPLTVEADSFSLQAVKMIVLTGGKVIKKQ